MISRYPHGKNIYIFAGYTVILCSYQTWLSGKPSIIYMFSSLGTSSKNGGCSSHIWSAEDLLAIEALCEQMLQSRQPLLHGQPLRKMIRWYPLRQWEMVGKWRENRDLQPLSWNRWYWLVKLRSDETTIVLNNYWLVVSTPLKNMSSSVGMILPNIWKIWKNNIHVPNDQSDALW